MRIMVPLLVIALAYPAVVACHPRVIGVAKALPADVQLKLSRITRVWIAGFQVTPNRDIDLDGETVRLLRHELRRATSLDVIEAEPLVVPTEGVLSDERIPRRMRYGIGRFAFTVPLYFELMERAMPDLIRVIAAGADLMEPVSGCQDCSSAQLSSTR